MESNTYDSVDYHDISDNESYFHDHDYEYESDGSEDNYEQRDSPEIIIHQSNDFFEIRDLYIPPGMKQYAWVVWCSKMHKVFEIECKYDIDNDPMKIHFTYGDVAFTLSVNHMKDDMEYPFEPPRIKWTGSKIILPDYLKIVKNKLLHRSYWNICVDLTLFIHESFRIIRTSFVIGEFDEVDNTLYRLVDTLGITFADQSYNSDLPEFGVFSNKSNSMNYLSNNEQTLKTKSSQERVGPDIDYIANNIDQINYHLYRIDIVMMIICEFDYDQISKLEICMNEKLYTQIVQIADLLNFENKCITIRKQINHLNDIETQSNDKVFFVERFNDHKFSKNKDTLNQKFVKRVSSEIELIRDTLNDFNGYVAISEETLQLMKILFIPDYNTPYGGGYFEFDVFISGDYPNSPPKIQFLTTGNGKIRFNPNLYKCGKVCLSILNTWAENQWNPSTSSLSQVILSIYTMIFIEHPYTNEPAYYNALDNEVGRSKSNNYNVVIRNHTADVAIKSQLYNSNSAFSHIIQKHWNQNKEHTNEHYARHNIHIHE